MTLARVRRRLFVVPLAPNDHGKTTLVGSLVMQAERSEYARVQKAHRQLRSADGVDVDAFVFVRSFQETEGKNYATVREALDGNDAGWMSRDLIVMPSHPVQADCAAMVDAAHSAGFDALVVAVLLRRDEIVALSGCLSLPWDLRWTIDNPVVRDFHPQVASLGRDLWAAIARALRAE